MVIVNKVDIKKSKIKSCADFSEVFVDRILDESFGYNEVRVIFDRYVNQTGGGTGTALLIYFAL